MKGHGERSYSSRGCLAVDLEHAAAVLRREARAASRTLDCYCTSIPAFAQQAATVFRCGLTWDATMVCVVTVLNQFATNHDASPTGLPFCSVQGHQAGDCSTAIWEMATGDAQFILASSNPHSPPATHVPAVSTPFWRVDTWEACPAVVQAPSPKSPQTQQTPVHPSILEAALLLLYPAPRHKH